MWYKNIASRFFGLVTKHACDRWTDGQTVRRTELRLPRLRWHSCVARQKPILLLGLGVEYRSRFSMVDVINVAANHQKFMMLTGELS